MSGAEVVMVLAATVIFGLLSIILTFAARSDRRP